MKVSFNRHRKTGFISYVLVLTTGAILTLLMVLAYRRASNVQNVQRNVQLRADYSEKEDTILRSIVAIVPNRAMRAMQSGSSNNATAWKLGWADIFTESLGLANARTSISADMVTTLGISNAKIANIGDSTLATPSVIFKAISPETGYVSVGINRSLSGYPAPLTSSNTTTRTRDPLYPIISSDKLGVGLTSSSYPNYNRLTYPNINFGYARPGDFFVAKRNWWAFSLDVAAQDFALTKIARPGRDFVLSIYEVPSQLAISAASYMTLGKYTGEAAWQNTTIEGGVFVGKGEVDDTSLVQSLASRSGMRLLGSSTIGGQSFVASPFAPGVRENYYQSTQGAFFPVSLASESGRVAFVPINRGADFFDRFSQTSESNVLSPTTWNNYTIGALQCAMRLDITQVVSAVNKMPTSLRFSYLQGGVRQNVNLSLATAPEGGYIAVCNENDTYNFGTAVVDVAYGKPGGYAYKTGVTGVVSFSNAFFGDPLVGTFKSGYCKGFFPCEATRLGDPVTGKICIAVSPQRTAKCLAALGADSTAVNHSLVVNVDYSSIGPTYPVKPATNPCLESDYGVILKECTDLTSFTRGFSLVTNLRTYIAEDFNIVEYDVSQVPKPAGYAPPSGQYLPPCSIFTPEKRYGAGLEIYGVKIGGQTGSLAGERIGTPIRPLDSKKMGGAAFGADRIIANLRAINHPAALPPINMMNWLVILEERRKEYVGY